MKRTPMVLFLLASLAIAPACYGQTVKAKLGIDAKVLDINVDESNDPIIHLDAYERGCDYEAAFHTLRERHPNANIYAVIDGTSVDHITHMTAMPEATLLTISYGRYRPHTKVVHVEDIEEFGVRNTRHDGVSVYFPQSTDHVPHDHHRIHEVDDVPHHHLHGEHMYPFYEEDCQECENDDHEYYNDLEEPANGDSDDTSNTGTFAPFRR